MRPSHALAMYSTARTLRRRVGCYSLTGVGAESASGPAPAHPSICIFFVVKPCPRVSAAAMDAAARSYDCFRGLGDDMYSQAHHRFPLLQLLVLVVQVGRLPVPCFFMLLNKSPRLPV